MLSGIQMNAINVVFTLLLFYVRGDTKPAQPKQNWEIHMLSFCLTCTLTNTWHLLSGSDVPWASRMFYLHTFVLIIQEVKEFSEESRGKWLYFDLHVENINEPTLYEEQYYCGSNKRSLPSLKMDSRMLFCLSGWSGGKAQTQVHKLLYTSAALSLHLRGSYMTAEDHNDFVAIIYIPKTCEGHISTPSVSHTIFTWWPLAIMNDYTFFSTSATRHSEYSAWHVEIERSQYSMLWGCY